MEILSVAHNIISVSPDSVSGYIKDHQTVFYRDSTDAIILVGWEDDARRIAEMIVNYLELSPEGKQKAEEYFLSSGNDTAIALNNMLKEIDRIRRQKRQLTMTAEHEQPLLIETKGGA